MPIDYSKWKDIEVSDDEDDTHPNIDTPSLFRWRHQARLERMAETKKEKDEVLTKLTLHQQRANELRAKLASSDATEEEKVALKKELDEYEKQEREFREKEKELEKKEKISPWNVDTISKDGFSKSQINKTERKKVDENLTEEEREEKMRKFIKENREKMLKFSLFRKLDDSKSFLLDNPQLCCEETANFLVIQCLNHEMEEKHELMDHVSHQSIVMQYLLELAKQLDLYPQSQSLISSFFTKMKIADKIYMDTFDDELAAFKERIRVRAKEKISEAMAEYEAEEKNKRMGPGGLDPAEVFESLPEELQKCFESRDMEMLKNVMGAMEPKDAQFYLQRCIDSGLWVPDAKTAAEMAAGGKPVDDDEAGPTASGENVENITGDGGKAGSADSDTNELRQRKGS